MGNCPGGSCPVGSCPRTVKKTSYNGINMDLKMK